MNPDSDHPQLPNIKIHHPPSPRHSHHHHSSSTPSSAATPTPTAGARRRIGVAVDLSEESAFSVRWAVDHYIRPGDAVVLLHVSPTSVLFGADWGPLPLKNQPPLEDPSAQSQQAQPSQEDFDAFTSSKVADLAKPLKEGGFPYKIHIVKDHDMRERLCLEIERLGLSAVIMGSTGFGAEKRGSDSKLGSVSDYCVHHCVCPVVVVRYPDDRDEPVPVVTLKTSVDDDEATKPVARHEHIKGPKWQHYVLPQMSDALGISVRFALLASSRNEKVQKSSRSFRGMFRGEVFVCGITTTLRSFSGLFAVSCLLHVMVSGFNMKFVWLLKEDYYDHLVI